MKLKAKLLIFGILAIAGGIIVYFFLKQLIILAIVLGIVGFILAIIALLIKGAKEITKQEEPPQDIDSQIRRAITKARQDKYKSETNIQKLTQWAQDTVMNTFTPDLFPNGVPFKNIEALEKWELIKGEYGNKLSYEVLDKCSDLMQGFIKQIELEKSKIKIFDKLQTEYEDLKSKMNKIKTDERKSKQIERQNDRLRTVQNDDSAVGNAIYLEYNMEDLNKEVALKEEYQKQLEQLQYQYGENVNTTDADALKQKIDEIFNKMDNK